MRRPLAGKMLALTGWLCAALSVGGCQSTSLFSKSTAKNTKTEPRDIAWKKSAPSTAMAQTQWTSPFKDEPVQSTAFQEKEPPKEKWMPPLPEIMIKDVEPPTHAVTMPTKPGKHLFGGHHHKAPPLPLPNAPNEMNPVALPAYVIRPADVLTVELLPQFARDKKDQSIKSEKIGLNQPIYGPHPVHPDGTLSLGIYGPVVVAGKTVVEARAVIARAIHRRLNPEVVELKDVLNNLRVDITNYNNGFYYVIINYAGAAGIGEVVERFPVTGTETVLDALTRTKTYGQPNLPGLPGMTSPGRIWVARPNQGHPGPDSILPVDWKGITQLGAMNTNWQVMPGDRIYLQAEPIRRFDNNLAKYLTPLQRLLGVAQQVNVLRNNNSTNLVAPPLP